VRRTSDPSAYHQLRHRRERNSQRLTAPLPHMGRPPALTPQQQQEARERRDNGATLSELAKSYNVGMATISRLSKEGSRMTSDGIGAEI
jgi:hypothetical protein